MTTIYRRPESGVPLFRGRFSTHLIATAALHHSAGPRARTKKDAVRLNRIYHEAHKHRFGDGIGYHLSMDDRGRLYELRPKWYVGAHVGGHNTCCFGIMVHGNYGSSSGKDRLNWRQRRTLKRLYRGHVKRYGFLGKVPWLGHQEFSGPTNEGNECPGTNIMRYLRWLRSRPR